MSRHKPAPAVDDVTAPKTRKKLIEVALPLEAINKAAAREKSIRHGHPSTLHMWWARRPLAAARAVIFSQMVDDPSSWPELFPTPAKQEKAPIGRTPTRALPQPQHILADRYNSGPRLPSCPNSRLAMESVTAWYSPWTESA